MGLPIWKRCECAWIRILSLNEAVLELFNFPLKSLKGTIEWRRAIHSIVVHPFNHIFHFFFIKSQAEKPESESALVSIPASAPSRSSERTGFKNLNELRYLDVCLNTKWGFTSAAARLLLLFFYYFFRFIYCCLLTSSNNHFFTFLCYCTRFSFAYLSEKFWAFSSLRFQCRENFRKKVKIMAPSKKLLDSTHCMEFNDSMTLKLCKSLKKSLRIVIKHYHAQDR